MSSQLKKWIKDLEASKKRLMKLRTDDRLKTCSSILILHLAILRSLSGWAVWLKNPAVLDQLSEVELKEVFDTFRSLAISFTDLDIKMSKAVLAKKPQTKKSSTYVS